MFCMYWQPGEAVSGVVVMVSLAMAVPSLQSQYQHSASHSVSWQGRQQGVNSPAEVISKSERITNCINRTV